MYLANLTNLTHKTVAPTAECCLFFHLSNPRMRLVDRIRDVLGGRAVGRAVEPRKVVLGGRKPQFVVSFTWCFCPFLTIIPRILRPDHEPVGGVGGTQEREGLTLHVLVVACMTRMQCSSSFSTTSLSGLVMSKWYLRQRIHEFCEWFRHGLPARCFHLFHDAVLSETCASVATVV